VIAHLRDNLDQPHQLEELANVAFCSPWQLVRIFSEQIGVTPMNFLSALRIQAAKTRLATTDDKVIDIAYDVGYNSVGSFGKRFTSLVGVSPRALRNAALRFDGDYFCRLLRRAAEAQEPSRNTHWAIAGEIRVPSDSPVLQGHVLIGLFTSGLPCGAPVRCVITRFPGSYAIADIPADKYTLLAAGIRLGDIPANILLSDRLLVGHARGLAVDNGAATVGADLELIEQTGEDSPILLSLPHLLDAAAVQGGLQLR